MKFTIEQLQQNQVQTKYGLKNKFRFTSGGQTFDAWTKTGFTDQFAPGYSFEAELTGRPYKGIDTIKWPDTRQQSFTPNNTQLNDAIKDSLSRIERKLDILLNRGLPEGISVVGTNVKPEIPFEGDPMPNDEDMTF